MRWQTTAVLALVLLLVGGFYYWYDVHQAPERQKVEGRKGRIFSAEAGDVTQVAIKRASDTVRLERKDDAWQVLEPVTARGDRGAIDETLTSIVSAKMDREIADKPASLADFGLDKPAAEVTLTLKDGKQLGLHLGAKNPTGVWVYARERDKPAVFVLGETVLRDTTRPVADFRDKTILAFDRKDVSGLDVVLTDDTLALETGDGKWKLTRPRALAADGQTVNEFLDKLQGAKVKEFVAEAPKSLDAYGLERPVRVAVHVGKDKDRSVKTLLLGKHDAGKGVYAMRSGESSVLLLPEDVWSSLPKTVAAVRDKGVLAFDREKVTRIEVQGPRGAVTLVRESDRWKITQPEAVAADQVETGAILSRLGALRAQAFVAEDAAGTARYLAKPEVRVTLTEQGAPAPRTLLLAPAPDKRDGRPTAYAGLAGGAQVVLVEATALTDLGKSMNELRDRTLVAGLEPKDVHRLQVRSDGKTVLLERRGDADWRVLEPGKGSARTGRVDDVLYGVRALKWKTLVAPKADDVAKYGLDKPAEVTLFRTDGTEIATVLLGKREGDTLYVKLKSAPTVYAIDAKTFELPKVPDDLISWGAPGAPQAPQRVALLLGDAPA
jgi:hypothetical protein